MSEDGVVKFSVSEFLGALNQTLEYAYNSVIVEGEVAGFKVNQGKWVFFDLKDDESSVSCFLPLFQLRMPLEDGMKIIVRALPKVTKWGKFSLTVKQMMPVGEGNIKKSFELLKKKLEKEGLFDAAKKRPIPEDLKKIGVISSVQAAGYADFCKILNERWGGLEVQTAHTQVQGIDAPDQIIRALRYFNEKCEVDIIAIIRGGGSADDLSAFNDEKLVREIAQSRIPVITGIGHDVDESLADLAADVRASTPSNVAEKLSHERKAEWARIKMGMDNLQEKIEREITLRLEMNVSSISEIGRIVKEKIRMVESLLENKRSVLESLNPEKVLRRGYAMLKGDLVEGSRLKILTLEKEISAKVETIKERRQ